MAVRARCLEYIESETTEGRRGCVDKALVDADRILPEMLSGENVTYEIRLQNGTRFTARILHFTELITARKPWAHRRS
ncbi:hypothetical protein A6833_00405 [Salmonella enterica]|uniref:Uncharacterized protein n=1 Tax=Salmonella enterica TaxID=28901 RepID=A0A3V4NIA4_SALER|nr:hypothetical protein [Salmonella enterica]EAB9740005.1 hypothetical protein [Salmonella enterica subsp. diarizonae]EAW1232461.1 hypothetical protein [Salmonella enterica subsp. enterica]EBW8694068.1 hypothetical protein [Salmonella enterica subsp. diarizonae serovar 16:z10:e,n,x,z15]ECG1721202.1 hypothetical protein [Salmonella enterica subsp. diarizonae serovar 17:z10:e,n,x,z15]